MQTPCDYQLAVADWEGRSAMEPTAWVPGLPWEMTVAAPASMQMPCDYDQLTVADWQGWPAMEPTAWVPGIPLEMTVAAPASNSDLVVSSSGQKQLKLVEGRTDPEHVVKVFEQAAESFKDKHDQMEMKIHLFPASMKDLAGKYAAPKVVSIGPYHHGETPALQQMESTKHVAAWYFIKNSDYKLEQVYEAVCEVADEARRQYDEDMMQPFGGDDHFKPMMFYDGCFLLQYMLYWCSDGGDDDGLMVDLKSAFSSIDRLILSDIVLLENQLPWVVVETLMSFMPKAPDRPLDASSNELHQVQCTRLSLEKFIGRVKVDALHTRQDLSFVHPTLDSSYPPPHLLSLLRHYIVGSASTAEVPEAEVPMVEVPEAVLSEKANKLSFSVSAMELAEIGIGLTATSTTAELKEMGINRALFNGELYLAPVSLDDTSACFLVNMAAFELCTAPDFSEAHDNMSTVCSYLCLLGMVTDSEQDVQELRRNHILQGGAGLTNKDALDLFTSLEKHLRPGNAYIRLMLDIENYRIDRSMWIMLYKLVYKNRKFIAAVVATIAGLASFLEALKSFK